MTVEELHAWLDARDATSESLFAAYHDGEHGGYVFRLGDPQQVTRLLAMIVEALTAMQAHLDAMLRTPSGTVH